MPRQVAIEYLFTQIPLEIVEAARFRKYVHISPGVSLPRSIAYQLSVGMNYLYFRPHNKALIEEAWRDFERRLRWRLYFTLIKRDDQRVYDPDYDVVTPEEEFREKKESPDVFPLYLELGLRRGRSYVYNSVRRIPDEVSEGTYKSLTPDTSAVRDYLVTNNLIVTGTDKNLGIAVSERTWIIERSWDILNSRADYEPISQRACKRILEEKEEKMIELSQLASFLDIALGDLSKFLRQHCGHSGHTTGLGYHVPNFYGIPKIHKQPVKFRPIIPCHSVIMNPAAKFISKMLKPIIQSAPAIIHGTKDLAIKLSKLHLQPGRKFYIVTGDVVAFYPNINLDLCLKIAEEFLGEYYIFGNYDWAALRAASRRSPQEQADRLMAVFKKALIVGNTKLVTQFQGKYFRQLRGLAMGVADSPDLANLYGLYFEKKCGILDNPLVPFYGRYIDDCLAIVYADSRQQALTILSSVQFDNCVIEWDATDAGAPFLDMFIYRDDLGKLQHKPYRKAQSHQERVPWVSHHPLDVKRGTFIGEMSRLATLSSLRTHYLDAVKGLVTLYILRGYPSGCIESWTRNNLHQRWDNRLSVHEKPQHGGVLVLKSEFNTAWNYFNAKELGETIIGYWTEWLERAARGEYNADFPSCSGEEYGVGENWSPAPIRDDPDRRVPDVRNTKIFSARWLVSRKRTNNLGDLTRLWKKLVLEKLERRIVAEVDVPVVDASGAAAGPAAGPSALDRQPENAPNMDGAEVRFIDAVGHYVAVPRGIEDTSDSDDELPLHVNRRRSPPVPGTWYGAT